MIFDFKKEYKEQYKPNLKPTIIDIPKINYLAINGKGDPNIEDGSYQSAIKVLYALSYTLKMSYKTTYHIEGFFEYVVSPLEGFWWQDNIKGVDITRKDKFIWTALIRLPSFINNDHLNWAKNTVLHKKKDRLFSCLYLNNRRRSMCSNNTYWTI